MSLKIMVHVDGEPIPLHEEKRLAGLLEFLFYLPEKWRKLMAAIDDLKAAVASEETAIQAVTTYLTQLAAQLSGEPSDTDLEAIVAEINQHVTELNALVPAATTTGPTT